MRTRASRRELSGLISSGRRQWECTASTDAPVYQKCSGHQKNGPDPESPAFRGQEETAGQEQQERRPQQPRGGEDKESRGDDTRGGQEEESRGGEKEEGGRGEDQVDP